MAAIMRVKGKRVKVHNDREMIELALRKEFGNIRDLRIRRVEPEEAADTERALKGPWPVYLEGMSIGPGDPVRVVGWVETKNDRGYGVIYVKYGYSVLEGTSIKVRWSVTAYEVRFHR